MMVHTFNPSILEAEATKRAAMSIQTNPVSKTAHSHEDGLRAGAGGGEEETSWTYKDAGKTHIHTNTNKSFIESNCIL